MNLIFSDVHFKHECLWFNKPFEDQKHLNVTLAKSEDPDEMPHDVAFHQGLHCLLNQNPFLEIITCAPSQYTMDYLDLTVSNLMGNSIGTQKVKKITWHLSGVTDCEMNLGAHTFMNISITHCTSRNTNYPM